MLNAERLRLNACYRTGEAFYFPKLCKPAKHQEAAHRIVFALSVQRLALSIYAMAPLKTGFDLPAA